MASEPSKGEKTIVLDTDAATACIEVLEDMLDIMNERLEVVEDTDREAE